jgi:NAD-dependent oxidoreductase involved in siderophore biosynthesis
MEDLSPEVLATIVAEKFGDSYGGVIDAVMREDLARRVEHALREAVAADRKAAAALCLQRQSLWVATEAKTTTPEHLRAEARSRANEAAYLADAIQSLP